MAALDFRGTCKIVKVAADKVTIVDFNFQSDCFKSSSKLSCTPPDTVGQAAQEPSLNRCLCECLARLPAPATS